MSALSYRQSGKKISCRLRLEKPALLLEGEACFPEATIVPAGTILVIWFWPETGRARVALPDEGGVQRQEAQPRIYDTGEPPLPNGAPL